MRSFWGALLLVGCGSAGDGELFGAGDVVTSERDGTGGTEMVDAGAEIGSGGATGGAPPIGAGGAEELSAGGTSGAAAATDGSAGRPIVIVDPADAGTGGTTDAEGASGDASPVGSGGRIAAGGAFDGAGGESLQGRCPAGQVRCAGGKSCEPATIINGCGSNLLYDCHSCPPHSYACCMENANSPSGLSCGITNSGIPGCH